MDEERGGRQIIVDDQPIVVDAQVHLSLPVAAFLKSNNGGLHSVYLYQIMDDRLSSRLRLLIDVECDELWLWGPVGFDMGLGSLMVFVVELWLFLPVMVLNGLRLSGELVWVLRLVLVVWQLFTGVLIGMGAVYGTAGMGVFVLIVLAVRGVVLGLRVVDVVLRSGE